VKPPQPRGRMWDSYLSVSSNGSEWVKLGRCRQGQQCIYHLSVSSNGSEWVKRRRDRIQARQYLSFSILKRIGVGETSMGRATACDGTAPFSILKRIGVGETCRSTATAVLTLPFSILKRIGVGETLISWKCWPGQPGFQYPQTDRSG